jgi:hypothetical protein
MFRKIINLVTGFFGSNQGLIDRLADVWTKGKDSEVEKERIQADLAKAQLDAMKDNASNQANVITRAMNSKLFWVTWSLATLPLAFWFALGVLDSALWNGTVLPDVAELPPQLKEYADHVWANIFYTGGAVKIGQTLAGVFANRR